MKILKLIDSKEYILDDGEANHLQGLLLGGKVKFILLSNGELINISSISRIGELDQKPHWNYYPVEEDKTGKYFYRDGKRVYLEVNNFSEIKYKDDPKYLSMPKISVKKQINEPIHSKTNNN